MTVMQSGNIQRSMKTSGGCSTVSKSDTHGIRTTLTVLFPVCSFRVLRSARFDVNTDSVYFSRLGVISPFLRSKVQVKTCVLTSTNLLNRFQKPIFARPVAQGMSDHRHSSPHPSYLSPIGLYSSIAL